MLGHKSFFELLYAGGFTLLVLVICSVVSLAVIIERVLYYRRRNLVKRMDLIEQVKKEMARGQTLNAVGLCRNTDTPSAKVALAGLLLAGHDEKVISNAMEREITIETIKLERFTSIVATIGGTAVYIGLFGTVLGIIRAFGDISKAGNGGMDVVMVGISEALVCTAAGLIVAIPAVIGYNYFTRLVDSFVVEMELTASEITDLLYINKK